MHAWYPGMRCGLMYAGPSTWLPPPASSADDHRFGYQGDAEALVHAAHHALRQGPQLRPGGVAVVDQHQRMPVRHAGVTLAQALEATLLDHPGSRQFAVSVAGWPGDQVRKRVLQPRRLGRLDQGGLAEAAGIAD